MGKRRRKRASKRWGKPGIFFGASRRNFFSILPIAAVILTAGALFMGVREFLYADAGLGIQEIVVNPSTALTIGQRQDLESRWLGKNMFQVDLQRIARSLEKDPQIQTARVFRHFPSTLVLEVERRIVRAQIRFSPKGKFALISEDGVILDILPKQDAMSLLIEAFHAGIRAPRPGDRVQIRGFEEGMKFLKAFSGAPLSRDETITRLAFDHLGNVTVTFGAGPSVRLGRRPLERLEALEEIRVLLEGEGRGRIEYVDLQYGHVIVKRKK